MGAKGLNGVVKKVSKFILTRLGVGVLAVAPIYLAALLLFKVMKSCTAVVRPLEKLAGYSVVECRLETGRTHQIRIHLSEAGHPLCGDKVYRGPFPGKPIADDSGAPRVALHAAEIGFQHPVTGEQLKFVMPLPKDMSILIERLRKK